MAGVVVMGDDGVALLLQIPLLARPEVSALAQQ
jgi:hypothetical protein